MQIHNRILAIISVLVIALGVSGQVLDLRSRHIADRYKASAYRQFNKVSAADEDGGEQVYLPTVMRLAPGTNAADLEALGVKLMRQRRDLVLAFVPAERIDQLVTFSGINRISISEPNRPALDRALPVCHADELIGIAPGMPRKWTGEGVVVGLTDIGIDPWHPNFLTKEGEPRIKRLVTYRDTLGVRNVATPLDAEGFVTDDSDDWHGTHVLGILAGGYEDTPYRGIASQAEIVATASMLTDACILDGVEEVIDYAHSVGKPAVVNMSVGSYTGPHDGSTLFNQYLDMLGEEAVIVMSAGNEGWTNMYFNHQFTTSEPRKSVCITDHKWYNCQRNYGSADFWSKDEREFQLALEVRDMSDFSMVATFPFKGNADAREWEIASPGRGTTDNAEHSAVFDRYYTGYFRLTAGVDPDNGRFHIYTSMDLSCTDRIGEMGRYFVTVTLQGEPGVEVDAYADAYQVEFNHGGTSRFAQPNSDRSISDIACGENVIVVGACTTRNTVPTLGGPVLDYTHFNEGEIGVWSSYGVLDDGRSLPHIGAPGCYLISSVSGEFINQHPEYEDLMSYKTTVDGRDAWWIGEAGTSMSAPYVAGVIALMLEEDPTLTVHEIREILMSTADTDMPDALDTRWGAGRLNAVVAMRRVMELNGVSNVGVDDAPSCEVSCDGRNIIITNASSIGGAASVYSLDGRCLISTDMQGMRTVIDASHLPTGIYVVHTPTSAHKIRK